MDDVKADIARIAAVGALLLSGCATGLPTPASVIVAAPQLPATQPESPVRRQVGAQALPAAAPLQPKVPATHLVGSQPVQTPGLQRDPHSSLNSPFATAYTSGNGGGMLEVAAGPVNYPAAGKGWQPIDPSFQQAPLGFIDAANLLKITAAPRLAILDLQNTLLDDGSVRWQPQELLIAAPGRGETVLATPLGAADAAPGILSNNQRTISYPRSGSDPALAEEVASHNAGLEQRLVIAQRPPAVNGAAGSLIFRTLLRTPAGGALLAQNITRTSAFTTAGAFRLPADLPAQPWRDDHARADGNGSKHLQRGRFCQSHRGLVHDE